MNHLNEIRYEMKLIFEINKMSNWWKNTFCKEISLGERETENVEHLFFFLLNVNDVLIELLEKIFHIKKITWKYEKKKKKKSPLGKANTRQIHSQKRLFHQPVIHFLKKFKWKKKKSYNWKNHVRISGVMRWQRWGIITWITREMKVTWKI